MPFLQLLTFYIHITLKRVGSSAVNDIDVPKQNLAIRICPFEMVAFRLERRIETDVVVWVHGINLATGTIDSVDMTIHAIRHDAAFIDCRWCHSGSRTCRKQGKLEEERRKRRETRREQRNWQRDKQTFYRTNYHLRCRSSLSCLQG